MHGSNQSHFANTLTWNLTGIFRLKTGLWHINNSYFKITVIYGGHLIPLWDLTTEEEERVPEKLEADDVSDVQ